VSVELFKIKTHLNVRSVATGDGKGSDTRPNRPPKTGAALHRSPQRFSIAALMTGRVARRRDCARQPRRVYAEDIFQHRRPPCAPWLRAQGQARAGRRISDGRTRVDYAGDGVCGRYRHLRGDGHSAAISGSRLNSAHGGHAAPSIRIEFLCQNRARIPSAMA
jgi:hypothetical protein